MLFTYCGNNRSLRLGLMIAAAFFLAEGFPAGAEIRSVNCDTPGASINAELALFADPHAFNTLNVSGTCQQAVRVLGFANLTLQGPANITFGVGSCGDAPAGLSPVSIVDSSNVSLNQLTITGGKNTNGGIVIERSDVIGRGLTVQQSLNDGVNVATGSRLLLIAPSLALKNVIADNCKAGVNVQYGALATTGTMLRSGTTLGTV